MCWKKRKKALQNVTQFISKRTTFFRKYYTANLQNKTACLAEYFRKPNADFLIFIFGRMTEEINILILYV